MSKKTQYRTTNVVKEEGLAAHCTLAIIPVVVMSAAAQNGTVGGKRILKKPVSTATIMAVVETYCGPAPVIPVEGVPI